MKTDILVIGGGLAGRRCAEEAGKDADVLLISNGSGASPYIHGINIPLCCGDSVACFISDTLKSGKYQNNERLVRILCGNSEKLSDEFDFDKNDDGSLKLLKPLGATYPRVAGIKGKTGVHILNKINSRKNFTELEKVRAFRLDVRGNKVWGVFCFDENRKKWCYIGAKAIVLACGGFCNIFPFSTNSSDIGGDGIAMAYEAGAELIDMEFIQFEPSAAVYPPSLKGKSVITTMLYDGAVIKNAANERFIPGGECVDKDILSKYIYREIQKGKSTENGGVYLDASGVSKTVLLEKYGDYVKRYADQGIDIKTTPMEIAPAPHTALGGVRINEQCATNISGLFACGEVTGGLHGANRLGGNAGLEVLIFGKIAGKSAAEYARGSREADENTDEYDDTYYDDTHMRKLLEDAVCEGLGVIRSGKKIRKAIETIEAVKNAANDYKYCFRKARLYNDALTALLALKSAESRKESVGCHEREDSVSENSRYTIVIQKDFGLYKEKLSPILTKKKGCEKQFD